MIRTARAEDTEALAAALARAFVDDPIARWSLPGDRRREGRLRRVYRARLGTLLREEMCFCDEERTGGALWAPADRWHTPLREVLSYRIVTRRGPKYLLGWTRVERDHPSGPHYYLAVLGVDPRAQGRGTGSALLRPMLERCDAEGVPAYLESSKERNLDFYGRHGFRVVAERRFPGRGPRIWPMLREPR